MTTRPKYLSSSNDYEYKATPGIANEVIVFIKKELIQFPMLKNLKFSNFLAWNPNSWKIHPHSFTDPHLKYNILAESQDSPQIIELRNTVGCLFTFENKYPETWTILENFLQKSIDSIWTQTTINNKPKVLLTENVYGINNAVLLRDENRGKLFEEY
jgi:hypothetical protein